MIVNANHKYTESQYDVSLDIFGEIFFDWYVGRIMNGVSRVEYNRN